MIKEHIIAPFDLGFTLRDFSKIGVPPNWSIAQFPMIPDGWATLQDKSGNCFLFLNEYGFGAMYFVGQSIDGYLDDEKVATAIIKRREIHNRLISGDHIQSSELRELRNYYANFKLVKRKLFWVSFPYVFGFFSVLRNNKKDGITDADNRRLAALTEPSVIHAEDTNCLNRELNSKDLIIELQGVSEEKCNQVLVDFDISDKDSTFISWASVVHFSDDKGRLSTMVSELVALEARLQTGWTIAFYVNTWKNEALKTKKVPKDIHEVKWNMIRLLELTDDVIDSSLGTRLKRIYEELIKSSGFNQERNRAERGIDLCDQYADLVSKKSEKKYRFIVEILLFLFGFCQVIPLIFDTPLVGLNLMWLWPITALFTVIISIRLLKER